MDVGCGAKITAFLVLRIGSPFPGGVEVGFVTGVSAPITPTGFAIFIKPFSLSSSTIPTVFTPSRSLKVPIVFF